MIHTPPDWTEDAVCATVDPGLFFPLKGDSQIGKTAIAICNGCPVREECLEWALEYEAGQIPGANYLSCFGVYGGKSAVERRQILQERARDAA